MSEPERIPSDDRPWVRPAPPLRLVPSPPPYLAPPPPAPRRPFPTGPLIVMLGTLLVLAWLLVLLDLRSAPVATDTFGPVHAAANWAGYQVSGGPFHTVTATWTVPSVSAGRPNDLASFWVGLDGLGTSSLEQIGTVSGHAGGRPVYRMWYEMLPQPAVYPRIAVRPGDSVTATVTTDGRGRFTLAISDNTTGRRFVTVQHQAGTALATAEVVAEAPWANGYAPLADFGSVQFTGALVDGKPIGSLANGRIDMVRKDVKASTMPIVSGGAAFTVDWRGF